MKASRASSKAALNAFDLLLPEFLGGSADLRPSNNTFFNGSKYINDNHGGEKDFSGNYISYSVREFGMSAIMKIISIFVYTHGSIGLGEGGPTHKAVEQISTLRMIPNMNVWRACG